MAEYDRIQKKQESRVVANSETGSRQLKSFVDNRMISNKLSQLARSGSHGKHKHFKVTVITIQNKETETIRFVNAKYDEDLGIVPTHGQGPPDKTYADALAVAMEKVTLATGEEIIDISFSHYTR